jgi:hypothetical protein
VWTQGSRIFVREVTIVEPFSGQVEDLVLAAARLDYEFGEFVRNARRIHNDNACLEAHLLHARTLIEFLIGRGRRSSNDITLGDFVSALGDA